MDKWFEIWTKQFVTIKGSINSYDKNCMYKAKNELQNYKNYMNNESKQAKNRILNWNTNRFNNAITWIYIQRSIVLSFVDCWRVVNVSKEAVVFLNQIRN